MQELIETFLRQAAELWHRAQLETIAGECLRLGAARNPRNTDAAELVECQKHRNKAARALLTIGRQLAPRLETAGKDSTPLLTFLHVIDAAGGPFAAAPLWAPLKVSLQRLAIQEGLPQAETAPPPSAANSTPGTGQAEGTGTGSQENKPPAPGGAKARKAKSDPTPTERIREQRLAYLRKRDLENETWYVTYDAYRKRYPKDEKASPGALRHCWQRHGGD